MTIPRLPFIAFFRSILVMWAFLFLPLNYFSQEKNAVQFGVIEVYIDSGDEPLSAYQIRLKGGDKVKLVGIEGGEHAAYAKAPYYDPKALQGNEIVLAAFSTLPEGELPHGMTRVASLHLQAPAGSDLRDFRETLEAAAGRDGKRIKAKIILK